MTTLKEIKDDLGRVAHASQLKATVAMLIGYLEEAGVQTEAEKEAKVNEERHRQVAQALTIEDLDAVVEGWGADFQPDADLERAVDERDVYLREQEAAAEAEPEIEVGDYPTWLKAKLQAEAGKRGLSTAGTNAELADRLAKDDEARAATAAATGEATA